MGFSGRRLAHGPSGKKQGSLLYQILSAQAGPYGKERRNSDEI